jgi:DNA replication initiation complex subunit (GINS family)
MYDELYDAWQQEIGTPTLCSLPFDFYTRLADYLKKINEENKMLDKKSIKSNLLEHEAQHVRRMLEELVWARYKKLLKTITQSQKVPTELLTAEEVKICESFVPFTDAYQKFANSLLEGQVTTVEAEKTEISHKRVTLRFSKNVPSVIGVDMKTYGPFAVEDIASLPIENAKILVKQGLAVLVEVS